MNYQINIISSSIELYNLIKNDTRFTIKKVYIEENPNNTQILGQFSNEVVIVTDYESFEKDIENTFNDVDFNLIFLSGIIIKENLIHKKNFYNIHPGSLITNRGRHPLNWSLINGDDDTIFTLHKINEKIDSGEIIYEQHIQIEYFDTIPILCKKLDDSLPLFIDKLLDYEQGKLQGTPISNHGIYRPRISEKDITIDFDNDSDKIFVRKINSQATYAGAVLLQNNTKYYLKEIIAIKKAQNKKRTITFHDNTAEIYLTEYTITVNYTK